MRGFTISPEEQKDRISCLAVHLHHVDDWVEGHRQLDDAARFQNFAIWDRNAH